MTRSIPLSQGKTRLPCFWRCGGGPPSYRHDWAFGWWTGPEGDLLCVVPEVVTNQEADLMLSPVCSNRVLSALSFLAKRFLWVFDQNLRFCRQLTRESDYDTAKKEVTGDSQ